MKKGVLIIIIMFIFSANYASAAWTCSSGETAKFAPLRPDPGNPCENYVPQEVKFQCGSSITPIETKEFNPYGRGDPDCKIVGRRVTCSKQSSFVVTLDLSKANLGILGNTQDENLTDEQKINEYLSWYLSGVPQVGDQKTLDPKNSKDMDRLVNFSGPVRKLLPYDLGAIAKAKIVSAQSKDVHNYVVGKKDPLIGIFEGSNPLDPDIKLKDYDPFTRGFAGGLRGTLPGGGILLNFINNNLLQKLFQNIPFSSLEDTVGEYLISGTSRTDKNMQDPDVIKVTVTP